MYVNCDFGFQSDVVSKQKNIIANNWWEYKAKQIKSNYEYWVFSFQITCIHVYEYIGN